MMISHFWCQNDLSFMQNIITAKSHLGQSTTSASFTRVGSHIFKMSSCHKGREDLNNAE